MHLIPTGSYLNTLIPPGARRMDFSAALQRRSRRPRMATFGSEPRQGWCALMECDLLHGIRPTKVDCLPSTSCLFWPIETGVYGLEQRLAWLVGGMTNGSPTRAYMRA